MTEAAAGTYLVIGNQLSPCSTHHLGPINSPVKTLPSPILHMETKGRSEKSPEIALLFIGDAKP